MKQVPAFADLIALAEFMRGELLTKKTLLLYAYNGTGKTRLSVAFKNIGKQAASRDTLYFNAFTEDLFYWDNDLDSDSDRRLRLNADSQFFAGLFELEMDTRIRSLLQRYVDFDFRIDVQEWCVRFSRTVDGQLVDNIKVSRGEENLFVWCFFLTVLELALDGAEAYAWVKFVYIDDPISSLDEHNAIAVANHLAQLIKGSGNSLKAVISTHHTLFFNVLYNEFGNARSYVLSKDSTAAGYTLREQTGDTPFFQHVAALVELHQAVQEDRLYTHHFNMLRSILEKTASFHGYRNFSACLKQAEDDPEGVLHTRLVNILSHGKYSLYEPRQMLEENKIYFKKMFYDFLDSYRFDSTLFPESPAVEGLQ